MASPEGSCPPAGFPCSPGPGLSPLGGLCSNMGHLSCAESVTPRRRLRLCPDTLTPGPSTPAGGAPEPSPSPHASSGGSSSCSQTPLPRCLPCAGSSGLPPAPSPGTDSEVLTGDFSRPCSLPLEDGQHRDLRYVSPATVAALLRGQPAGEAGACVVVDCRYPYEYAGGHIKGALNLYREEQLAPWFLPGPLGTTQCPRSSIVIFHCEFSSERGPRLCRSLRRMDRDANQYPELWYPELYVLRGGYKEFYQHFQGLCEPQG
ncbi:M-phase inducer phosphatase 3-like [Pelodiscus sinensis]|uniref:M-phase inducer phosphatase 3-like n=1 Tax=Pelodiscus sinensis TaxID=13735 RepID=UPI003F6BC07A